MIQSPRKKFKLLASLFVLCIVLGYAYYEARDLIHGATLAIEIPQDGETFNTQVISVMGHVGSIKEMNINGRPILTDNKGRFSEVVVLGEGYNEVSVTITDRFNRKVTRVLKVVYEPSNTLTKK